MKNKSHTLFFICWGLMASPVFAQNQVKPEETSLVKWLTFKEAFEQNKKQPKPFLVDIYTDWCGWCKHMMRTTYSDPSIGSYINNWFYPVKFNAETRDTIEYLGTRYVNDDTLSRRPTHQLAVKLLGNQLSYPSTIFLNNNFQFVLNTAGYLDNKKIEPILVFTVENVFRTTAYEEFRKNFEKTFYDTSLTKSDPKWLSFNKALELNKKKNKKMMVVIYTNWCNACRVMNKTSFSDSLVSDYIRKNYYLIDFNAETKDTILFGGTAYVNNQTNGMPFHQLAMALTKNNLILPSLVILDENQQIINGTSFYLSSGNIELLAKYFGDNIYKTIKWDDYLEKLKEITEKKPPQKKSKK
jgi:thioredoxin-related protein